MHKRLWSASVQPVGVVECRVDMVRLLMQWDIRTGHEQPYFEFVMREFAPGLMRLGIDPAEVWYTIYGNGPQMLTIGEVSNLERLQAILQDENWKNLHSKLLMHVTNYKQRVVVDNNRTFQL
jgi:hypothetical protein